MRRKDGLGEKARRETASPRESQEERRKSEVYYEQEHLLTGARSQVMILEVSIKSRSAELKTASLWKSEDILSLTDSNDSNAARTLQFKEMINVVN